MSKKDKRSFNGLGEVLAALFGAGAAGSARMIPVIINDGESLEDAVARTEAEHRAECAGCAAAYAEREAETKADAESLVAKAKAAASAEMAHKSMAGGVAAIVVGQHHIATRFVIQVPEGSSVTVGTELFTNPGVSPGAQPGNQTDGVGANPVKGTAYPRKHIGFMLRSFIKGETKYVAGSFETDRERAERKLALFNTIVPVDQLNEMAQLLGKDKVTLELVPVYAD